MSATITPTRGESLLLWRRREGLTQAQAAESLDMSVDKYREHEAGEIPKDGLRKHLGELKPHEVCYLLRRRAGMTQRELAQKMGCTRLWIIQMEDGSAPVERLRDYWGV